MESAEKVVRDRLVSGHLGTPSLYYLGNVFASERGLVFVDSHHLTPEANRTVAQAMVDRIRHALPDPPRARAEAPGF